MYNENFEEIINKHAHHLETFAAAFLKQVGSTEALKYKLVEERYWVENRYVTTWSFELK